MIDWVGTSLVYGKRLEEIISQKFLENYADIYDDSEANNNFSRENDKKNLTRVVGYIIYELIDKELIKNAINYGDIVLNVELVSIVLNALNCKDIYRANITMIGYHRIEESQGESMCYLPVKLQSNFDISGAILLDRIPNIAGGALSETSISCYGARKCAKDFIDHLQYV